MAKVALENPRAQVSSTADGLLINIRARRRPFLIFLLGFWAFFLFMFVFSTLLAPSRPGQGAPDYFAIVFPIVFMGIFMVPILWMLFAVEQVRVNTRELALGRRLFGLGRSREFDIASVKDLRSLPQPFAGMSFMGNYSMYMQPGSMGFDYGSRTYRFGQGLDEAEAKNLVKQICGRFPALAEKEKSS